MEYGLSDVLSAPQAKLLECPTLREGKLALSVDRKEDDRGFGDDLAQVLFGVGKDRRRFGLDAQTFLADG
jgi:hypothetical protein